ncbi:MAG TPA: ABC transporter permease [Acidobacteriota bacterium]|nr:ABC transporter permease [Acidobacteriota bacterium]
MSRMTSNLRFALRVLFKNPAFTVLAVFTLALGIAANTATFSLVNTILLRPLPYEQPRQLVWIDATLPQEGRDQLKLSYLEFTDWSEQNGVFSDMAAFVDQRLYLAGEGRPERLSGASVTPNLFGLLGVGALEGRILTEVDAQPGAQDVALISHSLWERRFGSDPAVLDRELDINDRLYSVVGVMPPRFKFPEYADVWLPLGSEALQQPRTATYYNVVARLKSGVTLQQAQAEMNRVAEGLAQAYPESNEGRGASVVSLRGHYVGDTDTAAMVFLGVTLFVLLIACANLANLLIARSARRRREMAVRSALGAGRGHLTGQLLTESVVLALLGAIPGVFLGVVGLEYLIASLPVDLPFWADFSLDWRVLTFVAGLAVVTGIVFGLAPVRRAWSAQLSDALRETGAAAGGGRKLSNALVTAEVAVALTLLVGAGLMVQGFLSLQERPSGFDSQGVLSAIVVPFGDEYGSDQRQLDLQERVLQSVQSLSVVEQAASSYSTPMAGTSWQRFEVQGFQPRSDPAPAAIYEVVSPGFFETLSIPLLRGRAFTRLDGPDGAPVAIVNQEMAQRFWPQENPLGQRLRLAREDGQAPWMQVVGVVSNVRQDALERSPQPAVYLPNGQHPTRTFTLLARTRGDPLASAAALRQSVWTVDSDLPIERLKPLAQVESEALWQPRVFSWLFGVFALLALTLSVAGIYGIVSHAVSQRTQEIAIRMSMGARVGDIFKVVLGRTAVMVLVGLALGMAGAALVGTALAGMLPGIAGLDPIFLAALALGFLGVAFVASFIPARRAVRVDPLTALRAE